MRTAARQVVEERCRTRDGPCSGDQTVSHQHSERGLEFLHVGPTLQTAERSSGVEPGPLLKLSGKPQTNTLLNGKIAYYRATSEGTDEEKKEDVGFNSDFRSLARPLQFEREIHHLRAWCGLPEHRLPVQRCPADKGRPVRDPDSNLPVM